VVGLRPSVSVIVPFLGSPPEARAAMEGLGMLMLREGDEVLLVDNGSSLPARGGTVSVVHAHAIRSSYHARNAGVRASRNPWLLFIDSDCRPSPSLIDDYFADPLPERCGIVAGEVDGDPSQRGIAARHAIAKSHLSAAAYRTIAPRPVAATVNMLVARAAWEDLGGFCEVRSGADFEFCLRAGARGWELVHQPRARVVHLHPERLRQTLAKPRRSPERSASLSAGASRRRGSRPSTVSGTRATPGAIGPATTIQTGPSRGVMPLAGVVLDELDHGLDLIRDVVLDVLADVRLRPGVGEHEDDSGDARRQDDDQKHEAE